MLIMCDDWKYFATVRIGFVSVLVLKPAVI
jgi:hypothetical protein